MSGVRITPILKRVFQKMGWEYLQLSETIMEINDLRDLDALQFPGSAVVSTAVFGVPPNTSRPRRFLEHHGVPGHRSKGESIRRPSAKKHGARRTTRRPGRSRSPSIAVPGVVPLERSRNQSSIFLIAEPFWHTSEKAKNLRECFSTLFWQKNAFCALFF
jgi:hypothetical protein